MTSIPLAYLWLLLLPLAAVWYVQTRVRKVFREEDAKETEEEISGLEAARELLNENALGSVRIEIGGRRFSDHYDPVTRILTLSAGTAERTSIAAVGVATHEVGHALQDAKGYVPMRLRNALARWLVAFATVSPFIFIGGFLFGNTTFIYLALAFVGFELVFALVTLPLELDASSRALHLLGDHGLIVPAEVREARRVLRAAAYTYLSAVALRATSFAFWFVVVEYVVRVQRGG
jgi:uncharacterized protein